jgi:hypothetical protein
MGVQMRLGIAGVLVAAALIAPTLGPFTPPVVEAQGQFRPPRAKDGKVDLNGIWQAMNTAHWDIQTHEARMGPVVALGAAFSVPGGIGVVENNEIPYQPAALEKKKQNQENWLERDPEIKCFMPGIPRATYIPYPFQIVQSSDTILMAYEYASASRLIRMNSKERPPAQAWMGWNIGRWDGDTLVIEVTDQMEDTWFDRAGNHHSEDLKVTERFTMTDQNTLRYDVLIEDPKVFTRPWKMSMPLYRRREPNMQLMEYKCVPFAEELMYGHLRKRSSE